MTEDVKTENMEEQESQDRDTEIAEMIKKIKIYVYLLTTIIVVFLIVKELIIKPQTEVPEQEPSKIEIYPTAKTKKSSNNKSTNVNDAIAEKKQDIKERQENRERAREEIGELTNLNKRITEPLTDEEIKSGKFDYVIIGKRLNQIGEAWAGGSLAGDGKRQSMPPNEYGQIVGGAIEINGVTGEEVFDIRKSEREVIQELTLEEYDGLLYQRAIRKVELTDKLENLRKPIDPNFKLPTNFGEYYPSVKNFSLLEEFGFGGSMEMDMEMIDVIVVFMYAYLEEWDATEVVIKEPTDGGDFNIEFANRTFRVDAISTYDVGYRVLERLRFTEL